ncbi:tail fiber domain-containing protein [Sulfurovum sp. CS9]|uniref:tail fiber domain-containing protein n=1 Tax=Sulfurovum sp. CS9 TaxID=3391146 RepID=UPI0039E923B4
MKNISKLVTKGVILSMILSSGVAMAASGTDETFKNLTLEERLYQYDGFGAQWGFDVGSDGLWLVPKVPVGGTYSAPFKLRNAAADNVLVIGGNAEGTEGYVGIGTDAPSAKLDVQWSGSNTAGDGLTNLLVLSATNSAVDKSSDAGFRLVNGNTSKGWNFRTNSGGDAFQATLQGTGGSEFTVKNATANVSGTELYLGNGAKNVGGVWINASSRALKENIKPLSTKEALTAFNKLQPVTYNYKSDKKEQVVGFIAEDVPELVAIQSRDGLSSMDMVAVLTKVVQEQDKTLAETKAELKVKDKKMAEMEAKIAKLEAMQKRLAKVESLLTNLALDTSNTKKEKISLNLKK